MNNPNKISFVVQAMDIKSDVSLIRDKDGFYTMPGYVFGKVSRNGKGYDTPHMVDCITNPTARFNRMLVERSLHGEAGHPRTEDFKRLCTILETQHAIFIEKVWTGQLKTGETVLWVRFKPAGPYGKFFAEALEDPRRNASLSIRAACKPGPIQNGVQMLYPKVLVTLDAVGGGGYAEACKRVALENSAEIMSMEDYYSEFSEDVLTEEVGRQIVATENYNRESLLEFFRADSITINSKIITIDTANPSKNAVSFHKYFV